jgi:insecticidal toxin complex protein TccC
VLQTALREVAGEAYVLQDGGQLLIDDSGELVVQHTYTRWTLSDITDTAYSGLLIKAYLPFFTDDWCFAQQSSVDRYIYGDTLYYDALGRKIKTLNTVKSFEDRTSYLPWFVVEEDANDTTENTLYSNTPTVLVMDQRGLGIRTLQYNRVSIEDELDEYITRHTYTALGAVSTSIDPRFFDVSLTNANIKPNTSSQYMLDQTIIEQHSVDAGTTVVMVNVEGHIFWSILSNGIQQLMTFDQLGRMTAHYQNGGELVCRQRFIYGEDEAEASSYNLRGKQIRIYDTAGLIKMERYSINGAALEQKRQILANIEQESNWHGEGEACFQELLDPTEYATTMLYDLLGNVTSQTDAKGNMKETKYDVSGKVKSTWIRLNQS